MTGRLDELQELRPPLRPVVFGDRLEEGGVLLGVDVVAHVQLCSASVASGDRAAEVLASVDQGLFGDVHGVEFVFRTRGFRLEFSVITQDLIRSQ